MSKRPITHRATLRPRAGLAATALLLAGLAGAGAATRLGAGLVEPASAQAPITATAAPRSTCGVVPAARAIEAGADAATPLCTGRPDR
ncbi:hypothetical protein [uncultured Methylobacterium sp.]|uniref:hypothetical protein n=1 Tax=uncultured Methylobacterium sp. TaxID=157278 RepID=UPI0035CA5096